MTESDYLPADVLLLIRRQEEIETCWFDVREGLDLCSVHRFPFPIDAGPVTYLLNVVCLFAWMADVGVGVF